MKLFIGKRPLAHPVDVIVVEDRKFITLNPRHDLINHSPDGFEWGYAGSGPSQLALAILALITSDEIALRHYQAFKVAFVQNFGDEWEMSEEQILKWLSQRGE